MTGAGAGATGDGNRRARRLAPLYLACYLAWAALSALGLWTVLQLRLNLIDLALVVTGSARAVDTVTTAGRVRSLDNLATIVLVLAWLGGVALLERYLRDGVPRGRLWSRAGRVLLAELLLLGLSYGLRALAGGA